MLRNIIMEVVKEYWWIDTILAAILVAPIIHCGWFGVLIDLSMVAAVLCCCWLAFVVAAKYLGGDGYANMVKKGVEEYNQLHEEGDR